MLTKSMKILYLQTKLQRLKNERFQIFEIMTRFYPQKQNYKKRKSLNKYPETIQIIQRKSLRCLLNKLQKIEQNEQQKNPLKKLYEDQDTLIILLKKSLKFQRRILYINPLNRFNTKRNIQSKSSNSLSMQKSSYKRKQNKYRPNTQTSLSIQRKLFINLQKKQLKIKYRQRKMYIKMSSMKQRIRSIEII